MTVIEGVHAVKYYVTVLPDYEIYDDWSFFVVTVTWRGRGRYAVYQGAWESSSLPTVANGMGEWDYEGSEQREDEAWLSTHRFDLETALTIARKLAPSVGIYSHRDKRFITATDLLEGGT